MLIYGISFPNKYGLEIKWDVNNLSYQKSSFHKQFIVSKDV